MLANTGPRTKRKARLPVAWSSSMISVPVMSDGIRSGVNWMRENLSSSAWATVDTISVLASPGTPSSSAWPPEKTGEDAVEHVFLADDAAPHLRQEVGARPGQSLEQLDVALRRGRRAGQRGRVRRHPASRLVHHTPKRHISLRVRCLACETFHKRVSFRAQHGRRREK